MARHYVLHHDGMTTRYNGFGQCHTDTHLEPDEQIAVTYFEGDIDGVWVIDPTPEAIANLKAMYFELYEREPDRVLILDQAP